MSRQVLRVNYTINEVFIIPKGIDLNDEKVVDGYWVKNNDLHILFKDGRKLVIAGEGWVDELDLKEPDGDGEILDAEEVGIDDEDFDDKSNEILAMFKLIPEPKKKRVKKQVELVIEEEEEEIERFKNVYKDDKETQDLIDKLFS